MMKKVFTYIRYTIEDFFYAIDWLGTREWENGEVPSINTVSFLTLLITSIFNLLLYNVTIDRSACIWLFAFLVVNSSLSYFISKFICKQFQNQKERIMARIGAYSICHKVASITISILALIVTFYFGFYYFIIYNFINVLDYN